jgi:hypothetical protein
VDIFGIFRKGTNALQGHNKGKSLRNFKIRNATIQYKKITRVKEKQWFLTV